MKALIVLLLLSVLFGCQKSSDQGSSQIAASAVTKVTEQTGRAGLGDDATFDTAWREGRAMPLEEAIEYALGAHENAALES